MGEDAGRYDSMEGVLGQIHSNFVALSPDEKKRNTSILNNVLDLVIDRMTQKNRLFDKTFQELFYGGSYFDGLKVSHPDEYDIHMLLEIPLSFEASVQISNVPGYINVKCEDLSWFGNDCRGFQKLVDGNDFMDASKVHHWIEKVLDKALNSFRQTRKGKFILPTDVGTCFVTKKNSGPAFTLHIECANIHMDVDLVPCFIFDNDDWPESPFIDNPIPYDEPEYYVVPKEPKGVQGKTSHYWVLNFQKQERELIKDRSSFKPALRLLKKMRDFLKHDAIPSYFLKNVALWVIDDNINNDLFWNNSLSYMFMTILKRYRDFLEDKEIPYYWNERFNLVKHVNKNTLTTIYHEIRRIINDVERNVDRNPLVIAKYLITREQINYIKNKYDW